MILVEKYWFIVLNRNRVFGPFKKFKTFIGKKNWESPKIHEVFGAFKALRLIEEANSHEFKEFYDKNRVHYPLTFSWSSQSNDVVERKNHSVFNIDRRILKSKRMYKELWVDSIFCAVSLSNQCPIKSCWWMFSRHNFCKPDSTEPDHFVGPIHVFILFF